MFFIFEPFDVDRNLCLIMELVQDEVYEDTESYAFDLVLDESTTGVFINQSVTEIFILDTNSKQHNSW